LDAIGLGKKSEYATFHTTQQDEEEDNDDNDQYTLPSFTGSPKYYATKVADSLALA